MITLKQKLEEIAATFDLPFNTVSRAYELIKIGKALPYIKNCENLPINHNCFNHIFYAFVHQTAIRKPVMETVFQKEPYYQKESEMKVENYNFDGLSAAEKEIFNNL